MTNQYRQLPSERECPVCAKHDRGKRFLVQDVFTGDVPVTAEHCESRACQYGRVRTIPVTAPEIVTPRAPSAASRLKTALKKERGILISAFVLVLAMFIYALVPVLAAPK